MDDKICEGPCYATVIEKNPPCPLQCGSKSCKSYLEKDSKFELWLCFMSCQPKADLRDHVFVWLYGGPSCGKTTICKHICTKYGFTRVHTGELLHQEIASGSVRAHCLQNAMDRGELVPNDMVLMLLKRFIESKAEGTKGFVIDGYPRDERQGMLFEKNIAPVNGFIYLDARRDTLTVRHVGNSKITQKRWPTEKRNDNCVAGKMQLHIFFKNHRHIFDQYPHKCVRINAERAPQEIISDVEKTLDKVVAKKKQENEKRKANEEKWKALEPKEKPSVPL